MSPRHGILAVCLLLGATQVHAQERSAPELLASLKGEKESHKGLAFTPDGKTLIAGGRLDVQFWEVPSGKLLRTLRTSSVIFYFTLSPRGDTLACLSAPQGKYEVRFIDVKTRAHRDKRISLDHGGLALTYTPDGKLLAVVLFDGTIAVYDTATLKRAMLLKRELTNRGGRVLIQHPTFSSDGKLLAAPGSDGATEVWDIPAGKRRYTVHGHQRGEVKAAAFAPDGKTLATTGWDGHVILWDAKTGDEKKKILVRDLLKTPYLLTFTRDSARLLVVGHCLLDDINLARPDAAPVAATAHRGLIDGLAISPDGRFLATTSPFDDVTKLWRIPPTPKR